MGTVTFTVYGPARGKERARSSTRNGVTRHYTPAKTVLAQNRVINAWIAAGRPRIDGPVRMTVDVYLPRPRSHWRVDGSLSPAGRRATHVPTKKPDWDNVGKLVADALNPKQGKGGAYPDDAAVADGRVRKHWADFNELERVVVTLEPLDAPERRA